MEKNKTTIFVILACILLIGITVSFAYYLASIEGTGKSITLKSKNLKITFTESNNLSGENISPGWSKTSTFTVKNEGSNSYTYNIVIKDLVNTFVTTGNLQYKITSTDGGYNMTDFKDIPNSSVATNKKIATNITIAGNGTHTYTILFTYKNSEDNQAEDMGKTLSGQIIIDEYIIPTLAEQLLEDNPTINTRSDFSSVFTETNTGTLYKSTESIAGSTPKEVYYFAGNVQNNWVKFGGYYWRIIRTNADGSVRLLFSGTRPDTNEAYIGSSKFNENYNSPKYVGYMYGNSDTTLEEARTNTNDSTIKTYIDNWYANNLTTYTNYLSNDAVYCNDRSVTNGEEYSLTSTFFYSGYYRTHYTKGLFTEVNFDCPDIKDAFSVNNTEAKLKYPIALITGEEIVAAGGKVDTNANVWYSLNSNNESITGEMWWSTMTPDYFNTTTSNVWRVVGSENLGMYRGGNVYYVNSVRPVISIASCALYSSGDGSAESPYEVNGGC